MELTLKEIEVQKLSLQPGDVLFVKMKGSQFSEADMDGLRGAFKQVITANKVFVMLLPEDHDVSLEVVGQPIDDGMGPEDNEQPIPDNETMAEINEILKGE